MKYSHLEDLINTAKNTHRLNEAEITALLEADDEAITDKLAAAADETRRAFVGDSVHLRGLIEFSNYCRNNCTYCGLRRDNQKIARFRLSEKEIISLAHAAKDFGYQTVVLQSGEDAYFTAERLAAIISEIKKLDFAVTLSIGEMSYGDYEILKNAGADRFLLRIETTDRIIYERYDPGMDFDNRVRCLRDLKKLGYEVGTGSLIGLPSQTLQSLARDILFFQTIDADMVGLGPLIANPDTPLAAAANGSYELTRRMVSLTRLLLPTANIPATTAVETLKPNSRWEILQSGANVIMPNLTLGDARKNYALYPGKASVKDSPYAADVFIRENLAKIGRSVANDKGFRKK